MFLFCKEDGYICWVEENEDEIMFFIMFCMVKEILNECVFNIGILIVFLLVILFVDNFFCYVVDSLGIDDFVLFLVVFLYDYVDKM